MHTNSIIHAWQTITLYGRPSRKTFNISGLT